MTTRSHILAGSTAILTLGAILSAASPAHAEKASLKSMSLDAQGANTAIHVISTDRQSWNALKPGTVQFWAHMAIDTKYPGYVESAGLVVGECSDNGCNDMPRLWSADVAERDYQHQQNFAFNTSILPVSGTGITLADQIIARCNQHLEADGPTKRHSFTHDIPATFMADTDKTWGNVDNMPMEAHEGAWPYELNSVDHTRTDQFQVQVVCEPVVKPATNDLSNDFGDFDVENVKLFLTTYVSNTPGSTPGTVCPRLKVTSRAQANQAGPVSMRLWRRKDGGAITSKLVQAWASFNTQKNGYFATYDEWEDVGATAYFQYKTEIVEDSPFAPSDGWKDITVHCTGAGGGGLTNVPQADPDGPHHHAEWTGELTIADSAGRDKSCPRPGQVFFAVTRPEPGDFHYRISCSNGAFFTGTAIGYDQGSGVFEAYGAHNINVNRTRNISCTLQELQPAPVTVATEQHDFTCANPAVEPGADDVSAEPDATHTQPKRRLIVVDPVRHCAPDEKLVRGRCVAKPIVSILCKPGFVLKGGDCVKKPEVSILCKLGFVLKGKTCVEKPQVSILCKTGFELKGQKCVRKPAVVSACPEGEKLVRGRCVSRNPIVQAKPSTKVFAAPKAVLKKFAIGRQAGSRKHKN